MGVYKLNANIHYKLIGQECILLDLNSNNYYELNNVSYCILMGIDKGLDDMQIATQISNKFDIEFNTALKDCTSFLNCLRKKFIIEEC